MCSITNSMRANPMPRTGRRHQRIAIAGSATLSMIAVRVVGIAVRSRMSSR